MTSRTRRLRRVRARKSNAKARAVELYLAGHSFEAIGERLGFSRETIRKYLIEARVELRHRGGHAIDPVAVMRALRTPGVETYIEAADIAGCSREQVRNVVQTLDCAEAIARLFRLRKRARMIRTLQDAARRLGRTPSAPDMIARLHGLSSGNAYQMTFGTIRKAQEAAGLPPAAQGQRAHGVRG